MPSRDANGKELTGNAKTTIKKQKEAKERLQQYQREVEQGLRKAWREPCHFDELPPPPMDDPGTLITWGAKVLAVVMDQIMLDPALSEDYRRRELKDCCAKLGMIRDKASEQYSIKKILAAQNEKKEAVGLTTMVVPPSPIISRPPG